MQCIPCICDRRLTKTSPQMVFSVSNLNKQNQDQLKVKLPDSFGVHVLRNCIFRQYTESDSSMWRFSDQWFDKSGRIQQTFKKKTTE